MPIRTLLRYLMNNEQVIQKLADSYPIKRAAQLTAYLAHKGKELGEEGLDKMQQSDPVKKIQDEAKKIQDEASNTAGKMTAFKDTFMKEMKEGMKEIKGKDKER